MKNLFAVLITLVVTPVVRGATPTPQSFETIRSELEFANVSTWMERIERQPDATGQEFARYFALLAPHQWPIRFVTEIKALVLLAYYVEMEKARRCGGDPPAHAESERYLSHYRTKLHPTSDRSDACVMTSAAIVFAPSFLRRLEDRAEPFERTKLFQLIIGTGRAFWTEQLLAQIFERTPPTYAEIVPLLSHVRSSDFERVARAIAIHGFDFQHRQAAINVLLAARQRRGPWPVNLGVGPRWCDLMLQRAAEDADSSEPQNSAD